MYICRHCGLEYKTDEAVMCPRCQAPKGKGEHFCPFCGTQVNPGQKICMNCGVEVDTYGIESTKSKAAAGVLGIFMGIYGVHNFYLGYKKRAVTQLVLTILTYVYMFLFVFAAALSDYVSDAMGAALVAILLLFAFIVMGVRIWSFVESIMILCGRIERDGKGRRIK